MTARPAWMAAGCVVLAATGAASAGTLDDMRRAGRFAICALRPWAAFTPPRRSASC